MENALFKEITNSHLPHPSEERSRPSARLPHVYPLPANQPPLLDTSQLPYTLAVSLIEFFSLSPPPSSPPRAAPRAAPRHAISPTNTRVVVPSSPIAAPHHRRPLQRTNIPGITLPRRPPRGACVACHAVIHRFPSASLQRSKTVSAEPVSHSLNRVQHSNLARSFIPFACTSVLYVRRPVVSDTGYSVECSARVYLVGEEKASVSQQLGILTYCGYCTDSLKCFSPLIASLMTRSAH